MLGDPDHEHSLREVLQSLDEEFADQMRVLEEHRKKIRRLLDEYTLNELDQPHADSPTFQFVQEHLAEYQSDINPALREQETQLYALLENFHWAGGQQDMMKEMALHFVEHIAKHPEEYQELLALGERLASLASLSEDAQEVEQLVEDFEQYFEKYPFLFEVQKQVVHTDLESPFSDIFHLAIVLFGLGGILSTPFELGALLRAKLTLFVLPVLVEGLAVGLFLSWRFGLSLVQAGIALIAIVLMVVGTLVVFVWGSAWDEGLSQAVEGAMQTRFHEEAPITPRRMWLLNLGMLIFVGMLLVLWKLPAMLALTAFVLLDVGIVAGMWRFGCGCLWGLVREG